jgi:hypothetical protein
LQGIVPIALAVVLGKQECKTDWPSCCDALAVIFHRVLGRSGSGQFYDRLPHNILAWQARQILKRAVQGGNPKFISGFLTFHQEHGDRKLIQQIFQLRDGQHVKHSFFLNYGENLGSNGKQRFSMKQNFAIDPEVLINGPKASEEGR